MTTQITAAEMIAIAKEELGYKEPASGKTKFGEWYGEQVGNSSFANAPWCDMFICWAASLAGWRKAGAAGKKSALAQVGLYAYTPSHAGHFAASSRFNNTPYAGSLAFFDWDGSRKLSAIDHIGLVTGTTSAGEVVTIEGNTVQGGKQGVYKRYRSRSTIVGFAHPYYITAGVSVKTAANAKVPKFPLTKGQFFSTTKHNGSTAADKTKVKQLQERLNSFGFGLVVDGEFGPATEAAVTTFQHEAQIGVDGAAGIETWTALWTHTP